MRTRTRKQKRKKKRRKKERGLFLLWSPRHPPRPNPRQTRLRRREPARSCAERHAPHRWCGCASGAESEDPWPPLWRRARGICPESRRNLNFPVSERATREGPNESDTRSGESPLDRQVKIAHAGTRARCRAQNWGDKDVSEGSEINHPCALRNSLCTRAECSSPVQALASRILAGTGSWA